METISFPGLPSGSEATLTLPVDFPGGRRALCPRGVCVPVGSCSPGWGQGWVYKRAQTSRNPSPGTFSLSQSSLLSGLSVAPPAAPQTGERLA